MAAMNFIEQTVRAAGVEVQCRQAGSGEPLLVVHGEHGVPGWLNAYDLLAKRYKVIVPSLPGFGKTEQPEWIMSVRDMAAWVTWFARDTGLNKQVHLAGFGMGGWIAAEIAIVAPQFINKLVLVGAAGVKPEMGEIWDYFVESARTGLATSFHQPEKSQEYMDYWGTWSPEVADQVELNREMTCRLAWKPYMHSLTLPSLIKGIATPTLLVWGRQDQIVPLNCGEIMGRSIPGAQLKVLEACGHMPEMEKPAEFAQVVGEFLS